MMMTKALLMLTGGRGVPDMLAVKYLKPDITLVLTTTQGLGAAKHLQNLVRSRFGCRLDILPTVDPFKKEDIMEACYRALQKYSDAEWIMNITSAPKIVSIFAMDVARERTIPCWFLNTSGGEVISLSKEIPINHGEVFDAKVEEYMDVYQRRYAERESPDYRKKVESWYPVAQLLAQHSEITHLFIKALRKAQKDIKLEKPISLKLGKQVLPFAQKLVATNLGFLVISKESTDTFECIISGGAKRKFLGGDWLEIFVYKEVEKTGFAQDYQWGYKVYHDKDEYELDTVLTSKGILLIGECKTDDDPFTKHSVYLDTLDANAGLLGQAYVSKFFITNHPKPETIRSYETFQQQAAQKKIRIINGDELLNIGEILREEAMNPTYERI